MRESALIRRTNEVLEARARAMRRQPTKAEQLLWSLLTGNRPDGLRFRRQHPFHPYILDFVCLEAMLVIEVDGESHFSQGSYDAERREYLKTRGFKILRFSDMEVLSEARACVVGILHAAYA